MGFNNLDFAKLVAERAFEGSQNIQQLFLGNNTFEFVSDENLHDMLAPMPGLKRLYLENSKLSIITSRTFSTLKNVEQLYLYGNGIAYLPGGAFDDMPKLQILRLENNLITTLSSDVFSLQTRSRQWLQDSPGLFQDFYGEGYRCTDEQNTTLPEFYLNEQACLLSRTTSNRITSVICLLLFFFFIFTIVFGYRWHIRFVIYKIYRARSTRRVRERRRQQIHYEFDVFVSYAEEDLPWVQRELLPALEARWGLRLCIHQRDFVPGKHIVDNIADCVDASDRILMVLSPHFAISPWCQFELRYCQGIAMDRDDVMVLVTLQDPGSFDVTGCMMAILRTTTYIQWGEGGDVTDSFWGRLRLALDDVIPNP
ncbi:toll-like receptor 2 type-2 [Littorina saxatilis]|uniref:toll-like receptor 2 type-2 n=1 Tax=Littorina saxatilis TaxID=31220 RepID=UPI0038B5EA7D